MGSRSVYTGNTFTTKLRLEKAKLKHKVTLGFSQKHLAIRALSEAGCMREQDAANLCKLLLT